MASQYVIGHSGMPGHGVIKEKKIDVIVPVLSHAQKEKQGFRDHPMIFAH